MSGIDCLWGFFLCCRWTQASPFSFSLCSAKVSESCERCVTAGKEILADRHMCIVWDGDHAGIPRQGLLQLLRCFNNQVTGGLVFWMLGGCIASSKNHNENIMNNPILSWIWSAWRGRKNLKSSSQWRFSPKSVTEIPFKGFLTWANVCKVWHRASGGFICSRKKLF